VFERKSGYGSAFKSKAGSGSTLKSKAGSGSVSKPKFWSCVESQNGAHNGAVERGVERLAVADSNNHFYEEQDPGRNPHQCENLDLDPHLHQTEYSDPDLDSQVKRGIWSYQS
jgi:hypothetical protein